jgi:putative addiction module antidote
MRAKVTRIGDQLGVILPREVSARMKVNAGDAVFFTETPGGYVISPYDPDFEAQLDSARRGMARYRNALRKLAE